MTVNLARIRAAFFRSTLCAGFAIVGMGALQAQPVVVEPTPVPQPMDTCAADAALPGVMGVPPTPIRPEVPASGAAAPHAPRAPDDANKPRSNLPVNPLNLLRGLFGG